MNIRQPLWYQDKNIQQAELYNNEKKQPIGWNNPVWERGKKKNIYI